MPKDSGNTQDLIDIEDVRENAVILKNGTLLQIIMVGGINFVLKSEEEQNVITAAYQNFLNSLDFPLQIIIHSRRVKIEKYLENLERYRTGESSSLLKNQIDEYREFIKGFIAQNAIVEKTFLIVVSFAPLAIPGKESIESLAKTLPLPFLKGKNGKKPQQKAGPAAAEEAEREFKENLEQLKQRTALVLDGLSTVGLETVVLNTQELIQLLYGFYNPGDVEIEQTTPQQTVKKNS